VFTEAVQVRMRAFGPPASELSGGLDSSTVAVVAQSLLTSGEAPLDTYSEVFPGRECDESSYIDAVVDGSGLASHRFCPEPLGAAAYEEQIRRYLDMPVYPNIAMSFELNRMVRRNGSRVLLTGEGGDHWLAGSASSCADLLRHLRPVRLSRQVSATAGAPGWPSPTSVLWHYGVKPHVPPSIRRRAGRRGQNSCPSWLRQSFADDIHLTERVARRLPRGPNLATAAAAAKLDDGWFAHAREMGERATSSVGQELRDPFDDRRVVEYALALPDDQRQRGPVAKHVLREALGGLLPDSVRTRLDKSNYSHVVCRELRLQGGRELFRDLALEDLGWVDGPRVRVMYNELERCYSAGDPAYNSYIWPVWLTLSVERWLQAVT